MKIESYLRFMADKGASDLYLTTGAPASIKVKGKLVKVSDKPLRPGLTKSVAYEMMTAEQQEEFERKLEMNLGLPIHNVGRFRVNIYRQRGEVSMVIRYISARIPSLDSLNMPLVLKDQVMHKSGLVLVVGATGAGKSTTLASMIEHRNQNHAGHILTIEDPIEFTYNHGLSIIGQREVGIDTLSYKNALREAMREAPDVILIGEIRDHEAMEAAISFADTGHLVLSTLHAVNANQALDRMINMFPADQQNRIFQDLSLNLRCIVSQRLITGTDKERFPAAEVLINTPFVADLIDQGRVGEIKEVMEKSASVGMQTFDQSLLYLYQAGKISKEEALSNADSRNNLEWRMNFSSDHSDAKNQFSGNSVDSSPDVEAMSSPEMSNQVSTQLDPTTSIMALDGLQPFEQSKI